MPKKKRKNQIEELKLKKLEKLLKEKRIKELN